MQNDQHQVEREYESERQVREISCCLIEENYEEESWYIY